MFNFLANLFGSREQAKHEGARFNPNHRTGKRRQYRKYRVRPVEEQVPGPDVTEKELMKHPWWRNQNQDKVLAARAKAAEAAEPVDG